MSVVSVEQSFVRFVYPFVFSSEAMRKLLENLGQKFERSDNLNECCGYLKRAFSEIENAVDLLISIYGQMLRGTGLKKFLSR